jgi:hypothetical protein
MRSSRRLLRPEVARRAAAAVLFALVAAGCGDATAPGVTVSSLESDVRFGTVPSPGSPAAAPAPVQVPTLPGVLPMGGPSFQVDTQPKLPPLPITGATQRTACPDPVIGTSAGKAVTYNAEGQPVPGYYLYKVTSGKTLGSFAAVTSSTLVNVKVLPPSKIVTTPNPTAAYPQTRFTYAEVLPMADGGAMTYTFDVVNYPIAAASESGEGYTNNATAGFDDGVSIVSEVRTNKSGAVVWSFNPTTPITLIPLPVTSGTTFVSHGTDPTTGQSLSLQATVVKTDRLVGCGVFIQAWQVKATQVGRAPQPNGSVDTINGDATYDVATQFGGLVIATRYLPTGSGTFNGGQFGTITPTKTPAKTS